MTHPKISVITPSFNQGIYIEDTIKSIISQEYPNVEYMVIDGGSEDESVNIIRKYESKINYWISEKDTGQSEAINKGLRLATGDIITWINSDDQLMPGALTRAANHFTKHPEMAVIHGKTILFKENDVGEERGDVEGLPFKYLAGMAFSQPSSFFKREALKNAGWLDQSLHYGMDYDFFVRLYLQGDFLFVNEMFSKYRLHNESKTMIAQENFAKEWATVFSKVLRSFDNTKDLINVLKNLSIYDDQNTTYSVDRQLPVSFLRRSLSYFIYFQIIFYYQSVQLKKVESLALYLKENDPDLFFKHNLGKVYWRSRWVPATLLKTFRNL